MFDVRVCAACLATDVRMYSMSSYSLLQPYQLLTGVQIENRDGMPGNLCWECAALVNKFNLFRDKCERAHLLLRDMYEKYDEIIIELVHKIDRTKHQLVSTYTKTAVHNYVLKNIKAKKPKMEPSPPVTDEFQTHLVKPEYDTKPTDKLELTPVTINEPIIHEPIKLHKADKINEREIINEQITLHKHEMVLSQEPMLECIDVTFDIKSDPESDAPICEPFEPFVQHENDRESVEGEPKKKQCKKTYTRDFNSTEIMLTEDQARQLFTERRNCTRYLNAKYKCEWCYRTFIGEGFYAKHLERHQPSFGRYVCDICRLRFKQKAPLRVHFNIHHTKKYICNLCNKVSTNRGIAKLHHRRHEKQLRVKKRRKKSKTRAKVGRKRTMDYDITTVNLTQEQMMEVIRERSFTENYTMSKYKCTLCYRGFREDKTYNNHMLLHDPVTGALECDICKFRMKTRSRVHKHITNYHLRKYICNICDNVNYSQDGARIHYMYHTGVQYPCHICGEKFRKMSSRLNHLRIKHPSDHVCGVCSESFVSPLGLKRHARLMHSTKPDAAITSESGGAYCEHCDIQFTTQEAHTRHILISPKHERERADIHNGCRDCGKTFSTWIELKNHRRTAHPAKQLRPGTARHATPRPPWQDKPCIQCGELMTSDRKYRGHFQVKHPGDPWPFAELNHLFICEVCGKGFNCNANLIAHRNFHTGTRAYKCDICPKSFFLPFNLKMHYIAHSEERPHVCLVCRRGFKVKNGLERHMRSHTGEKPYVCTTCGKPFSSSTGRNAHMRAVHHKEPPLAAPFHRRKDRAAAAVDD